MVLDNANNLNYHMVAPIINPFLEGPGNHIDQLFQMELIRPGGVAGSDNNIFLFGYYDTQADDIIVCLGRAIQDQHWGRCSKLATLRHLLMQILWDMPGITLHFLQAEWAGPAAANQPAFPHLEDLFEMLEIRMESLVHPEAAASFDVQLVAPEQEPVPQPVPVN